MDSIWLIAFFAMLFLFHGVALVALVIRRNDLADVAWGPGFALSAGAAALLLPVEWDARKILVLSLVSLWALRLFLHIGVRTLRHEHEDSRYANWRRDWGTTWLWRSYLQVFMLQGFLLYLFLTPVLAILGGEARPLGLSAYFGLALWIVGMFFEAVSDDQLRKFKSNPANKGKLMTEGLWAWTRHPNYFGEITLWWGIWFLALEVPHSEWTVVGPLALTFVILRVSGVSMMEAMMKSRPGYEKYAATVPVFFPKPPRGASS